MNDASRIELESEIGQEARCICIACEVRLRQVFSCCQAVGDRARIIRTNTYIRQCRLTTRSYSMLYKPPEAEYAIPAAILRTKTAFYRRPCSTVQG
jgi:hypothetical protein